MTLYRNNPDASDLTINEVWHYQSYRKSKNGNCLNYSSFHWCPSCVPLFVSSEICNCSVYLSTPVGFVEVETVALDDNCLRVHHEVALNDLSLTGTGAPIAVHKSQRPFSIGSQGSISGVASCILTFYQSRRPDLTPQTSLSSLMTPPLKVRGYLFRVAKQPCPKKIYSYGIVLSKQPAALSTAPAEPFKVPT